MDVPIEKISIKNINDTSRFSNTILKQIYNSPGELFIATDYFSCTKKSFNKNRQRNRSSY